MEVVHFEAAWAKRMPVDSEQVLLGDVDEGADRVEAGVVILLGTSPSDVWQFRDRDRRPKDQDEETSQ